MVLLLVSDISQSGDTDVRNASFSGAGVAVCNGDVLVGIGCKWLW